MATFETVIVVLLVANSALVLFLLRARSRPSEHTSEGLALLQRQLHDFTRTVDTRIGESNRTLQESVRAQLQESSRIVREVTHELTTLSRTNEQVVSFAEQLRQLQDVLQNPKQRGVLGEYYLETVLQNVLPPGTFTMQYAFSNGEIVDAAVLVKDKVIPVDAKFSLENYNRLVEARSDSERAHYQKAFIGDLKLRIQETAKYIRPREKTTDFAFMFIPSEGIYYDLLSNAVGAGEENLVQRAAGKHRVIIVSPTSFLAYLQTVLQGLKALEIEEKALDIVKNVEKLGGHIARYEEYYQKLGRTLETTVNHYNTGYKELGKIDKDITRITEGERHITPAFLEKPLGRDAS